MTDEKFGVRAPWFYDKPVHLPCVPWPSHWTHRPPRYDLTRFARWLNWWHRNTWFFKPWCWANVLFCRPYNRDHYGYRLVVRDRVFGHTGRIYYTATGFEPDDRCSRCGELLD